MYGSITIEESLVLIVAIINLVIAIYVLTRNIKRPLNQAFFIFGSGIALWAGTFSILFFTHKTWISELNLFAGLITVFGLALFASVFPDNQDYPNVFALVSAPFVLAALLIPSGFFISRIGADANGNPVPQNGPYFYAYVAVIAFYMLYSFAVLYRKYRKLAPDEKVRVQYMLLGSGIFMGAAFATDALLPALGVFNFNMIGPVASVFFISFTAYAIVRHHLFNIRALAAQLFTIALSILVLLRVIYAKSPLEVLGSITVFIATLILGALLVRNVQWEIRQKEKMQELAAELEKANRSLTELSRFKTQLLSLASHQLKSPLAIIKGYASLLLDDIYGELDPKVKGIIFKMKSSTDQLVELVNTLLDLRKVEEGKMDYQLDKLDLGEMLGKVVESLQPLASARKITLRFEAPRERVVVAGDISKLPEVFRNLVDNAIKYTPQGEVAVSIKKENGQAVARVKDSGIGISAELLPRLFEEFVRDERVRREIQGTGFGLYIARKMVDAHGGRIWAESPGQGQGSTFAVSLPLASK
jgi:signal transduction histidine kinase